MTPAEPPASMRRVLVPDRITAASPCPTSRKRISSCWAEIGRAVNATARARRSNATRFMIDQSYAKPSGVRASASFRTRAVPSGLQPREASKRVAGLAAEPALYRGCEVEEPAALGPFGEDTVAADFADGGVEGDCNPAGHAVQRPVRSAGRLGRGVCPWRPHTAPGLRL